MKTISILFRFVLLVIGGLCQAQQYTISLSSVGSGGTLTQIGSSPVIFNGISAAVAAAATVEQAGDLFSERESATGYADRTLAGAEHLSANA